MCGIAGAFSAAATESQQRLVEEIVASQIRRGPDHQAVESIAGRHSALVLGHNRLSIIDLSPEANQPMWDTERRCCLVFNGEIYNYLEIKAELKALGHRFVTQSDSEVILEAFKEWGRDAVPRFNGMFAFALYDAAAETLWLFRDRFGVKPLFYVEQGGALYFASTGTVLASRLGLLPNLEYVARGLRYWVYEDDGDLAPYAGMKALPASHGLEARILASGRLSITRFRYYDLQARVMALRDELSTRPAEDLVAAVAGGLRDAVNLRLRSDVPVGVSLSGGLDSSSVAAFLSEKHREVVGFTFGHPDAASSEGPVVRELSSRIGIRVHYIWPTHDELRSAFWDTCAAQDAPFPGGSIVAQYLVYKAARAQGVKVLLGGQGGDEGFMGYRKFQVFWLRQLLREGRWAEAALFLAGLARLLFAELPSAWSYWAHLPRYLGPRGMDTVLRLPDPAPLAMDFASAASTGDRALLDFTRFSLPTLLRYEDRNSMGNSVESRLPFLDYHLAELALALPERLKVYSGYGKWAVRQAVKDRIPRRIWAARYKKGFDVNQTDWIERGLGHAIRAALRSCLDRVKPWLAPKLALDGAFSDGRFRSRPQTWAEAVTLLWLGQRVQ
ncbi:MAG: asparagine synthase (glutamine-hydrolyzing) [Planctomycetota bacterium]|nr:asparagine synthase (glutamine-hydrolyzing) [Planctomycetota bacterium]